MSQNGTTKKKKQKTEARGKIFTVELAAFAFLAIYLAGYTVSMIKKPKVGIETVAYGQIDVPRQFDGLILRDETVAFSNEAGTVIFSYGENEYVKKDSVVCVVRDKNGLDALEREIETLNDSILSQQSDPAQTEEIKRINSKMQNEVNAAVSLFMTEGAGGVYSFKSQMQKDIETRNGILLSGADGALSALVDKRAAFEQQVSDGTGSYLAGRGGVLSYGFDGMESQFTPESIANITKEQVEARSDEIGGEREVAAGDALFKIVGSNTWYLCTYLDNELVLDWKKGESMPLYFKDTGETKKLSMRINEILQREDKTYVVFSSSKYLIDFINKRHVKFSLEDDTYKGLKIPNTAIIEKTALLIPSDYIYEFRGSNGVYVKENNGFVFKSVNLLSHRDGMAYVMQNFDSVKLGTEVYHFKDGRAVETGSYVIEEIKTTPGVYVANSGTAEFRQIEILNRNERYSIVEKSSGYGVKSFDSIVSDASAVTDNQIIR